MADSWQIRVYDQAQSVFSGEVSGKVELGRQGDSSERIYSKRVIEQEGRTRLVVADRNEDSVSRHHALLEPIAKGLMRLENLSSKVAIRLQDGTDLAPRASCELPLPARLTLGRKIVSILEHAPDDFLFQGLPEIGGPTSAFATPSAFTAISLSLPPGGNVEIEQIFGWLKTTMRVLQSAASSTNFFDQAARALVETVSLDTGRVVLLRDEDWETVAAWSSSGQPLDVRQMPSRNVLTRVRNERRTLWQVPEPVQPGGSLDSLLGISAVVASPIVVKDEVIGVMYGDRRKSESPGQPPTISKLDAMHVDVLAACVAAGLARMESDRKALESRVQFEQFFTPELAHLLADNPELLEGQESEITLLFADIRGFSRISEHLGPAKTVKWVNDVMSELSTCVLAHDGVLVDYIGDELMAMWGAPKEQPDHATRACRAALDMLRLLPALNARFRDQIREPMDLGIGINTGVARVGNTGSRQKFKYGPLGNTVNLASRVQGLTKYLKARLLVTHATREKLGVEFSPALRRLGQARVVNIAEPTDLYELALIDTPQWDAIRIQYESALGWFERKEFNLATKALGTLITEQPEDGPTKFLLSRVLQCLVDPDTFDPVFVAPGK